MFNIGLGEILIVLVVAFVVVGPDDLPRVARWLGRGVRKLRLLIRDIKQETGWDEVEKEVREVQKDVRQTVRELDISADLKDAAREVKAEVNGISRDMRKDIRALDADMKSDMKALDGELRAAANDAAKPVGDAARDVNNHS